MIIGKKTVQCGQQYDSIILIILIRQYRYRNMSRNSLNVMSRKHKQISEQGPVYNTTEKLLVITIVLQLGSNKKLSWYWQQARRV